MNTLLLLLTIVLSLIVGYVTINALVTAKAYEMGNFGSLKRLIDQSWITRLSDGYNRLNIYDKVRIVSKPYMKKPKDAQNKYEFVKIRHKGELYECLNEFY